MKGMGDYVNDVRAALTKNPNFCRQRYKGNEVIEKTNGFIKAEDASTKKICNQDSNGNIYPTKDINDQSKKVSFRSEQKAIPIRRRASDTSLRESRSGVYSKTVKRPLSKEKGMCEKSDLTEASLKRNQVEGDTLIHPIDDIHDFAVRNYPNSVSKETMCDLKDFCEHSLTAVSQETCASNTDTNVFFSTPLEKMSLEDVVALYSVALNKDPGDLLKYTGDKSLIVCGKKKRCNLAMFYFFVLIPSLLFYLLVFVFTLQLEPFYSLLLKRLKLRHQEPEPPTLLPNFLEMLLRILLEYTSYSQTILEHFAPYFN